MCQALNTLFYFIEQQCWTGAIIIIIPFHR